MTINKHMKIPQLFNTVWLNNCLHFDMRCRQEYTSKIFDDVIMKQVLIGRSTLNTV